ncbi:MAG: undecaprenyl-diphosphatase UppP [Bifidobacteriaceae bacterium]|jgi:undecaprenyl-diphosphatase|nr:undecaprenyl-diphosphatase UppP [Bifidobacteriaceae bacterium]
MHLWEALVLGLVQGLTEFLPISSSAHLRILGEALPSAADPGAAFTAIIQIGTELAVLVYFRREVWAILKSWTISAVRWSRPRDQDAKLGWLIILGSAPIVLLGFCFQDAIETRLRNLYITGAMLIVFGLLLGAADMYAGRAGRHRAPKTIDDLGARDGLWYGLAQALALIPGVSRSGGTITAGLALRYSREAAARYSFLLAMPAVFGAGILELVNALGEKTELGAGWGATIAAALVAFCVGYLVIIAFLKIVSTYSYKPFVYYRIGLGALVIALVAGGVLYPV